MGDAFILLLDIIFITRNCTLALKTLIFSTHFHQCQKSSIRRKTKGIILNKLLKK